MIWESYAKRQARDWKMQSALAGLRMTQSMGAMMGGAESGPTPDQEVTPPAALVAMGLPVTMRKAEK